MEDLFLVYRIINKGYCSLKELQDRSYSIKEFFIMQHMCDLDDYIKAQTLPKDY